jgi:hypothetical protein
MIAAWSVDRLGRSLQHLIGFLNELQGKREAEAVQGLKCQGMRASI